MKSGSNVFSTYLVYIISSAHLIFWDMRNETRFLMLFKFDHILILVMGFVGYEIMEGDWMCIVSS